MEGNHRYQWKISNFLLTYVALPSSSSPIFPLSFYNANLGAAVSLLYAIPMSKIVIFPRPERSRPEKDIKVLISFFSR